MCFSVEIRSSSSECYYKHDILFALRCNPSSLLIPAISGVIAVYFISMQKRTNRKRCNENNVIIQMYHLTVYDAFMVFAFIAKLRQSLRTCTGWLSVMEQVPDYRLCQFCQWRAKCNDNELSTFVYPFLYRMPLHLICQSFRVLPSMWSLKHHVPLNGINSTYGWTCNIRHLPKHYNDNNNCY